MGCLFENWGFGLSSVSHELKWTIMLVGQEHTSCNRLSLSRFNSTSVLLEENIMYDIFTSTIICFSPTKAQTFTYFP